MRRELVLARLRIPLAELSQFITPEPYPPNGKIVSNPSAGHVGWYVMEEVQPEMLTSKGLTNMLRDATVGTLQTTMNVTTSTLSATVNATTATANAMMAPLRNSDDADALGTSSTGKLSNSSTSKATGKPGTPTTGAPGSATAAPATKAKNNVLSVLSSDQPRENVTAPQLKIRIRIVEEKE